MADVICRWRNATPKTVCEFVKILPHEQMSAVDFRLKMGSDFFRTAYQLACQLGLYYEDNGIYIPRFEYDITEDEAKRYLEFWIHCYYAPNPFTKSLKGLETPVFLIEELVKRIENENGEVDLNTALTNIFHDPMGNLDIITNAINNYSKIIQIENGKATLVPDYKTILKSMPNRHDKEAFFKNFDMFSKKPKNLSSDAYSYYRPYITAVKSKPSLLLAGISGTGKSRIVRELARACWEAGSEEYKAQKPKNFEMIQVKPNWHDSSELIGYVSRVSGKAEFVAGGYLKFVAKAWEDLDTPYFLCLDEMNLAPVEQYFAEYLSVVESRKCQDDGIVTTDSILEKANEEWYFNLTASLTSDENVRKQFNEEGISIPQNLIVIGTVNMDETTFSFSRKVLDRAMTIEMNEVDLYGGLTNRHEAIGKLSNEDLVGNAVEGVDVYSDNKEVCDIAINYLAKLNKELDGTPFKVAYRTRNEFLLYVVNNLPYSKDENGNDLPQEYVIARALDEITNMKVLSRIEGDDTKVTDKLLDSLMNVIEDGLKEITDEEHPVNSVSLAKLKEMKNRLSSGYTSFWS
jgi:hypothetical protein